MQLLHGFASMYSSGSTEQQTKHILSGALPWPFTHPSTGSNTPGRAMQQPKIRVSWKDYSTRASRIWMHGFGCTMLTRVEAEPWRILRNVPHNAMQLLCTMRRYAVSLNW